MSVWQIQLLGGLRATHGNSVIAQFPSRPIAMLLARLALEPQRRHYAWKAFFDDSLKRAVLSPENCMSVVRF